MKSKALISTVQVVLSMGVGSVLFPLVVFSQSVSSIICSDCVSMPKAIVIPLPLYPQKAKEDRISGKVEVRIVIGENGNVIEAKTHSGPELLREPAESAAMKARFTRAKSIGTPSRAVKVFAQITYNFVLDDSSVSAKDKPKIGIVNGMASYLPKPAHSKLPIDACASGQVRVQVLIGKNGRVQKAEAISGNRFLRNSAVNAAKLARFRRNVDGAPLEMSGIVVYNYPPSKGCQK